jgi:hypothetical protein
MLRLWRRIFGKTRELGLPQAVPEDEPMALEAKEIWSARNEPESSPAVEKRTSSDLVPPTVSTSFRVGAYGEIIETELPPGPEHPRIVELRELAKTLGARDQVCPYCQIPLTKFPQRKTKCKTCSGQIYSRKEPLSGQKRLFKENELDLFGELYELSLGTWNWWNDRREGILATKSQLSLEWGIPASKISDGDAQWRIFTRDADDALSNGQLGTYRSVRVEMIRHLMGERRFEEAKGLTPCCIFLAYSGYARERTQFEKDIEERMRRSNPKTAAFLDQSIRDSCRVYPPELSLYFGLFASLSEAEHAFLSDTQVETYSKSIPVSKEEAWGRFAEDWRQYGEALARLTRKGKRLPDALAQHVTKDSA